MGQLQGTRKSHFWIKMTKKVSLVAEEWTNIVLQTLTQFNMLYMIITDDVVQIGFDNLPTQLPAVKLKIVCVSIKRLSIPNIDIFSET